MKRRLWLAGVGCIAACGGASSSEDATDDGGIPEFEPPVAINAEPPVSYPPALFREGVEGTVVLLMFVDETGQLVPDSTRIQDSSGYTALDSAVLAGVDSMRFAPARRNGQPVATWFLQPVQFRRPDRVNPRGGL